MDKISCGGFYLGNGLNETLNENGQSVLNVEFESQLPDILVVIRNNAIHETKTKCSFSETLEKALSNNYISGEVWLSSFSHGETTLIKYYTEIRCFNLTEEKSIVLNLYEVNGLGVTAKGGVVWDSNGFTFQAPRS